MAFLVLFGSCLAISCWCFGTLDTLLYSIEVQLQALNASILQSFLLAYTLVLVVKVGFVMAHYFFVYNVGWALNTSEYYWIYVSGFLLDPAFAEPL